ncbi:MAG: glycerophosphodiester phosphodiesterase [Clostridia bacterium]|nr:glycerophosphodiester phosphodiesterase [Clostridia bacterium]
MTTLWWIIRVCFILLALYCFLTAPNLLRRKLSHRQLTGHDYAHRGLHDKAAHVPENSLPAFSRAVRAGYGIELDVRLTRDHVLVVHHDETLERSCGDKRRVCDVPLAELQKLPLFATSEHVPTLDEVLDLVDGQVPLIVELKTDFYQKLLPSDVYERLRRYKGVYCVESFDPMAVRWFRKNAPKVVRGQLAMTSDLKGLPFADKVKRVLLGWLLIDFLGRPDFIAYDYEGDSNPSFRFVVKVFRPLLAAWTVRDEETCRALRQEYDMLIFERFRAARDA